MKFQFSRVDLATADPCPPKPTNGASAGPWERPNRLLLAGLLFVLGVVLFLPTIRNGFVSMTDDGLVIENPHVVSGLSWSNLKWAFHTYSGELCQPLTWLSHMTDCQVFGLNPWGHHLTSVLLHGLNTALFFLFLSAATGTTWRSLAAAALFGVHPLRVESVAWVASAKTFSASAGPY